MAKKMNILMLIAKKKYFFQKNLHLEILRSTE